MRYLLLLLLCLPLAALALDYRVEIDAPQALQPLLEENLDLLQLRSDDSLQERDLEAMLESTPAEAKALLETEGYFSAEVSVQRDGQLVHVRVNPGLPVTVGQVNLQFSGAVTQVDDFRHFIEAAQAGWTLPHGAIFRQADWDDSKKAALRPLLLERFPRASITASRAEIDPATRSATLTVSIDSGPLVRYGPLQISGNERYPESVIRGQANFREGGDYRQQDILDYQSSLEKDSHYSGVVVAPLWEQLQGDRVPIGVTVSEVKRQKLELGLNYSTGDGPGVRLGYEHYNLFRRGYTGSVVYDWKHDRQKLDLGLALPRETGGYSHAVNLHVSHEDVLGTQTDSRSLGVFRIRQVGNIESRLGLEYVLEQERDHGVLSRDSKALIASYGWTQRAIDNLLRPSSGYLIEAQVASTVGELGSDTRFQRGYVRLANYWSPDWLHGTLVTRVEGGQVFAADGSQVPTSRLFKAGGAGSVRGYQFESLGVKNSDGTIEGGRVLATSSIEYQYPVTQNWRAAVFVDAGDAASSWQSLNLATAYGVGARWLSPLAPLAFDLAHGNRDKRWRWNLNLGLAF
ncbi:autotransporter assembly complex family protein [Vogesella sp. LIG4]|uniref:autotransporter assembly complex protein TamA n=1 Tax=Vogesella sp. LIG4 TaxID=1192162 RepID=UPI00081FD3F3|nr:autotransporter assembly complex family protein [Vogesella sp. LIG4]SCK11559.1 autotransporter secretion outer membrane protein TamA [Vogesella sp. LIG4]